MSIQIKLKNSVVQDSTPSTSDLPAVGEIALNANINSIGGFMRASDNSIVKIFGPGSLSTPTATTTVSGISELATNSETTTGTATNRVVTPAGLNAVTVAERTTSNTNYVAKAGSTLTGVLTMPNGSNSAPAINFGDSDSGIFGGTNTVSLTAGGTTRLTADTGVSVVGTLAVTGAITSTSDLTIADKIIHAGDTNTAVRFPAADTVSVETGGSERARFDSSGRLLVGTSTARSPANVAAILQVEGTDAATSSISITRNSANTNSANLIFNKSRGAAVGSDTVVQNNDSLGIISFAGNDGTDSNNAAAQIAGLVDGSPGSNDMPGRLEFKTTADGAALPTTRLTIDSTGKATFTGNIETSGTLTVGGSTFATDGTLTTTASITVQNAQPGISFVDTGANPDFIIQNRDGLFAIRDTTNAANRFLVNMSNGAITGTGDMTIDTNTLHVDSSNNRVGIGITSPDATLEVNKGSVGLYMKVGGDNDSNGRALEFTSSTISSVGALHTINARSVNGAIALATGGSEAIRVDSSGRLLIGTSTEGNSSADDLTISTSGHTGISLRSGTSNNGSVFFADGTSGANEYRGWIQYTHTTDYLTFGTNAGERLRIDSNGRLLLGNTTLGEASADNLTITDSAHCGITIRSGSSSGGNLFFTDLTSGDQFQGYVQYDHSNDSLAFGTQKIKRMSIDASGRVLIGTTTEGTVDSDDLTIGTSGNTGITIRSGTTHNGAIHFSDATSGAAEYAGYLDYDHNVDKFDMGNNSGRFLSSDSNRVVSIGNASFGGSSGVIGYGSFGGVRKDSILALNASATVAGRGAGISVGGSSSALGSFYCNKAGNADSDGGSVFLESVGALYFRTNGANDRANIDSNGNFLIGTTSVIAAGTERPFQIQNTGGPKIALGRNDTSISAGNTMGGLEFYGNDSDGTFVNCASIIVNADDTHSTNSKATRMQFFTTANNSASATERLRITNAGQILLGGATASHGSSNADDLQIGANNQSNQTGITLGSASGSSVRFADAGNDTAGAILYAHGDDTMRFTAASSERVRIDSDGIKFNGDSASSNGLHDYEEGTFTPAFSNGLVFATYNTNGQRGVYTKIGRFVYGTIRLDGSAVTTQNTNQIKISGLPFASANFSNGEQVGGADPFFQDGFFNANDFSGIVNNNSSVIQLVRRSDGTSLTGTSVNGGRQIRVSFWYMTA